jgi:pimeloyl-ACP methyl ester carboxylesterase
VVPEDPARPAGAQVRLHVTLARSPAPDPARPPLLLLAGGPGEGTLAAFAGVLGSERASTLAAGRDLVLVDVRGSGLSSPRLSCPDLFTPATLTSATRLLGAARRCASGYARRGIDLQQYGTARTAGDLEAVRVALGIARWDVYGVSYGTRLAQLLLRDHPAGVRRLALDSVSPLAGADLLDDVAAKASALRGLLDRRQEHALAAAIPRLNARPLEVGGLRVSGDLLLFYATNTAVLTAEARDEVRRVLAAAARRRPGPLGRLLSRTGGDGSGPAALAATAENDGLGLAVTCGEDATRVTPAALARLTRRGAFAASLARSTRRYVAACGALGVRTRPGTFRPPVSGAPALLLAGSLDPATPPYLARRAARTLRGAVVEVVPGQGHGLLEGTAGDRVARRISAFLAAPA